MTSRGEKALIGTSPLAGLRTLVRRLLWLGGGVLVVAVGGLGVLVSDASPSAFDTALSIFLLALLLQLLLGMAAMVLAGVGWSRAQRLGLSSRGFRRDVVWGAVLGVGSVLGFATSALASFSSTAP